MDFCLVDKKYNGNHYSHSCYKKRSLSDSVKVCKLFNLLIIFLIL